MNRTGHRWVFAMYLLAVGWSLSIGWAQDKPTSPATQQIPEWEWVPNQRPETRNPSLPATVKDGFTFAAGGDLLGFWLPRTPLADPGLAKVLKIFKDADVGFANKEGNVFDLRVFNGSPAAENGNSHRDQMDVGGGPLAVPAAAQDMKEAGIDMVSLANNHATDWGLDGLAETERVLDEAGIVHAGSGRSRAFARGSTFLETGKGRVALVATASTFAPMSVAGPGKGALAPRPGISALRVRPITLVTESEMVVLRGIATRQGHVAAAEAEWVTLDPNDQIFNDLTFRVSARPGLTYEVNPQDRDEILQAIHVGKLASDLAVFSIHAHETASGGQEWEVPPDTLTSADFLRPLFHDAVDAGADVVVTHGPHVVRGVEIYKGKPIFYGLGNLFYEVSGLPPAMYDSVLAVSEFRGGQVAEVRLYPLDLGGTSSELRTRTQQGVPRLASPENAKRIIGEIQRDSAQYGTRITMEKNVGVIRVAN